MNLCKEAVFTERRLIFEKSCISRTTDAVIVKRCTSRKDLLLETEESNDQFRNSKQQVKITTSKLKDYNLKKGSYEAPDDLFRWR